MTVLTSLHELIKLNGDTYSSAEVMGIVRRSAAEIERLQSENFRLAANQCDAGYMNDHGTRRCQHEDSKAQMRETVGAAMIAIGLAKAIPEVAAEYDFEPVYKQLTDAWRASEPAART